MAESCGGSRCNEVVRWWFELLGGGRNGEVVLVVVRWCW